MQMAQLAGHEGNMTKEVMEATVGASPKEALDAGRGLVADVQGGAGEVRETVDTAAQKLVDGVSGLLSGDD